MGTIKPARLLAKALLNLVKAEDDAATAKTKHQRWVQATLLEEKKKAFEKAKKRVKRERSHKQLRDMGLMD